MDRAEDFVFLAQFIAAYHNGKKRCRISSGLLWGKVLHVYCMNLDEVDLHE